MSEEASLAAADGAADIPPPQSPGGWGELLRKEDWWSVWLGLAVVIIAYALFAHGSNLGWIAVAPAKWATLSQLRAQLAANAVRYAAQFGVFLVVLTAATSVLGQRPRSFIPSFVLIYVLSGLVFAAGAW